MSKTVLLPDATLFESKARWQGLAPWVEEGEAAASTERAVALRPTSDLLVPLAAALLQVRHTPLPCTEKYCGVVQA